MLFRITEDGSVPQYQHELQAKLSIHSEDVDRASEPPICTLGGELSKVLNTHALHVLCFEGMSDAPDDGAT